MTDEGGVLGNLPNSRPGKRSAKRERPASAAEKASLKAEASGKPAAKPARTSKAARTGAKAARTSAKPGRAAVGAAKPGRAAAGAATPRGRTTAVKGAGIEDEVAVNPAMRGKGRNDRAGEPEPSRDAVGAVVRTAAGLTFTGFRVAGAVTQELLRRLPRP
jgi:hypothetical protein